MIFYVTAPILPYPKRKSLDYHTFALASRTAEKQEVYYPINLTTY